jgi:hypothetical protein
MSVVTNGMQHPRLTVAFDNLADHQDVSMPRGFLVAAYLGTRPGFRANLPSATQVRLTPQGELSMSRIRLFRCIIARSCQMANRILSMAACICQ